VVYFLIRQYHLTKWQASDIMILAIEIDSAERSATMGKELGSRITETLQRRGMTQKELAGRIGVTEAVMSRYVSGDREPKPDVLANIATALHTTSDFLLGIECEEFDHPRIRRLIARNASSMTEQEKRELINALFGEE
jgi:transcriptional regulator with XRE-family HTH domain